MSAYNNVEFWKNVYESNTNEATKICYSIDSHTKRTARFISILDRPKSVVDLGCGNGFFLHRFKAFYPNAEYTGVDIHDVEFDNLKKRYPDIKLIKSEIEKFVTENSINYEYGILSGVVPLIEFSYYHDFFHKMMSGNIDKLLANVLSGPSDQFTSVSIQDIHNLCDALKIDGIIREYTTYMDHLPHDIIIELKR